MDWRKVLMATGEDNTEHVLQEDTRLAMDDIRYNEVV